MQDAQQRWTEDPSWVQVRVHQGQRVRGDQLARDTKPNRNQL